MVQEVVVRMHLFPGYLQLIRTLPLLAFANEKKVVKLHLTQIMLTKACDASIFSIVAFP